MTFKTMLAGKAVISKLRPPFLASPKLDGVRCHIIDGVAVSRNLLPFRNPQIQAMFGNKKFNGLDGELMVGDPTHPEAFRKAGRINSFDGDCSEVRFHVFDDFTNGNDPFRLRLLVAHKRIRENELCVQVSHVNIETITQLEEYEIECLDRGYEGVMIRDPAGLYKYGRSTTNEGWLLKMKQFEDSEAEIIGAEEKMHNANEKTLMRSGKAVRNTRKAGKVATGVLGAFTVRDIHSGVEFSVGSGFDDPERIRFWDLWEEHPRSLKGKIIKYRYFPSGSKDKPRFPTFLGFRDPGDI